MTLCAQLLPEYTWNAVQVANIRGLCMRLRRSGVLPSDPGAVVAIGKSDVDFGKALLEALDPESVQSVELLREAREAFKLALKTDGEAVHSLLCTLAAECKGFFYQALHDKDANLVGIYFQTAAMRARLLRFGQALFMDAMARINPEQMPLTLITIMNEEQQCRIGACAITEQVFT